MSFGIRLKELREGARLTQEELARKIKKTRSTVAGYETENKEPNFDTLVLIAGVFDVSLDYLIGKSNVKNNAFDIPSLSKFAVKPLALAMGI